MRSLKKGGLSAVTPACRTGRQVKVLSPEILHVALGQGVHFLETYTGTHATGECVTGVPGSESTAGKRTVHIGTWENRNVPTEAFKGAGEVMRRYVIPVVGPTHSRGVGRVMPVDPAGRELEGVGSSMQRDWDCDAIH